MQLKNISILLLFLMSTLMVFCQKEPKEILENAIKNQQKELIEKIISEEDIVLLEFNKCSDINSLRFLINNEFIPVNHIFNGKTLFELACDCNDTLTIIEILNIDRQIIYKPIGAFQSKPILLAAKAGNYWGVKYLLKKGADIKSEDFLHRNILFYAVKSKNIELITFLINSGIDINQRSMGILPIHNVFTYNQSAIDVLDFLIEKQNLNHNDYYELMFDAIRVGDIKSLKYFFEKNYVSNINYKDTLGKTIHFDLKTWINNKDILKTELKIQILDYLINKGLEVNSLIDMIYLERYSQKEMVYYLIEKDANLNVIYKKEILFLNYLPLEKMNGQIDILYNLLEQNLKITSFFTSNPIVYLLHEIIVKERLVQLDYWLSDSRIKTQINFTDDNNHTILDYAKSTKNRKIIKRIKQALKQ